jgi:hypothetical protein
MMTRTVNRKEREREREQSHNFSYIYSKIIAISRTTIDHYP